MPNRSEYIHKNVDSNAYSNISHKSYKKQPKCLSTKQGLTKYGISMKWELYSIIKTIRSVLIRDTMDTNLENILLK